MDEFDFVIDMPNEPSTPQRTTDSTGWEMVIFELADDD